MKLKINIYKDRDKPVFDNLLEKKQQNDKDFVEVN
jgi:hypothetical protein